MGKLQVLVLGTTQVVRADGSTITDLGGVKPRQLLGMLAVAGGAPVSKERLVDQLWGDNPPRTATATLESYVSLLRRRLGVPGGRDSAVATTSKGYMLNSEHIEVDLQQFRRLVTPTSPTSSIAMLGRLERAVALVSGDVLASEPYAEWALQERAHFDSELVRACSTAAHTALATDRPQLAAEMARRAIRVDRVSETAWHLLVQALAATGARNDALRAYLDFREIVIDELGSEPGAAIRGLYLELLQEDSPAHQEPASTHEVKALLRLLRQALESIPGIELPRGDGGLGEIALQVVGAA